MKNVTIQLPEMKPRDYFVLTALWVIARKRNKYAFQYSLSSLANETGLSIPTVHKAVRNLEKLGLLKVSKLFYTRKGSTRMRAIYHLNSQAEVT